MSKMTMNFQRETVEMQITELVAHLMKKKKISRAKLAENIGKNREYITKFLQDATQFTLSEISDIFYGLDECPRIST